MAQYANRLVSDPTKDTNVRNTQNEVAMALVGGRIVVAFQDDTAESEGPLMPNRRTRYAVSDDGGYSFKYLTTGDGGFGIFYQANGTDYGDPWLASDSVNSRLYYSVLSPPILPGSHGARVLLMKSLDSGATWTAPVDIAASIFPVGSEEGDKPNIVVDNSTDSGPGQGYVYAAWRSVQGNGGAAPTLSIELLYSSDAGATWNRPPPSSPASIASTVYNAEPNLASPYPVVGKDHTFQFFGSTTTFRPGTGL